MRSLTENEETPFHRGLLSCRSSIEDRTVIAKPPDSVPPTIAYTKGVNLTLFGSRYIITRLMTNSIVVGEIDRISRRSGHGMLRADGQTYNLGPINRSALGNTAIAVPMSGSWALCLTPYDDPEKYISRFCSTTGIDQAEIDRQLRAMKDEKLDSVSDVLPEDTSLQDSTDYAVGDAIEVEITLRTSDRSYVIFEDGNVIEVVDTYLPTGEQTIVEIVEVGGLVSSAKISPEVLERAQPGAELTVTIERKTGSMGYSSQNGVPIVLPECPASEGDTVRVAVTEYLEEGVEATIAALPVKARPEIGDVIKLEVDLPAHNSTTFLIHNGIPIKITQTALPMEGSLPIEIIDIRTNTAIGHVALGEYSGLSEGAQLSLEELTHDGERLISKQKGIPVVVSLKRPIPSIPDSIPVTVTGIGADAAYASIRHRPEICGLQDGIPITVNIIKHIDEYLVAEYESYPVWVSWPFNEIEHPPTLTVEITKITRCGLFACPPVLSEVGVSQNRNVLPARVEAVQSDHIFASIVEPVENEAYVLPVKIPLSFEVSGEIGIEIVGQEQSYLVGIVRALETGETAAQVPVYLQKFQEIIFSIREQNFEAAAESARAAADATENVVQQAEALRFQIFASAENILSSNGSHEQVLNELANLSEKVDSLDLPDTYRGLIDTELNIYEEVLSIGADQVPPSVQGLQRIAYNVDTRGRIDKIAGQIQRELVETATDVDFDKWTPEFPHRLLVFRVSQVCTQFESPPEKAAKLINQYPSIERLQWRIAPVASSEPSPAETVSVVPKTLEHPSDADESSDTVEASGDGLSGSDSSEVMDTSEDDQSSPEPSVTAKKDADVSGEPPESQPATEVDTDTSASAETTNRKREPVKESDGIELNPTDETDSADGTKETQDTESLDIESTTSIEPPATTSELSTLRDRAEAAASDDPIRDTSSTGGGSRYQRSPAIKKYVEARADGVCEMCGEPAPFETPDGRPYLETHHVDELGQGGKDHPDKVAAVCPTCHKRIHYGEDGDALNEALRERLEQGLADVGVE